MLAADGAYERKKEREHTAEYQIAQAREGERVGRAVSVCLPGENDKNKSTHSENTH